MKLRWLARAGAARLLVFFNGWGMDEWVVAGIAPPPASDLLEIHDYTDLDAGELECVLESYPSCSLVAWSFGVWAAAAVFAGLRRAPQRAVAINGTCRPIDEACGIPPRLFQATVERFSAASRDSFFRRMCADAETLASFRSRAPRRDLADQAAELRALGLGVAAAPVPPSIFSQVVVGRRDRIMPPENQRRCWDTATALKVLPIPHYPFFDLQSWEEILGGAAGR